MQITVNETNARTLADTRPMMIDGDKVYVVVEGGTASLMVGGRIVAEREAQAMSAKAAQDWAVEYRTEMEETVAEATAPESVYAAAVEQIHTMAEAIRAAAEADLAQGNGPVRIGTRQVKVTVADPRHPARRAAALLKEAARLADWTAQDERAYNQYLSDGLGDTDGWFVPKSRTAWALTIGA